MIRAHSGPSFVGPVSQSGKHLLRRRLQALVDLPKVELTERHAKVLVVQGLFKDLVVCVAEEFGRAEYGS